LPICHGVGTPPPVVGPCFRRNLVSCRPILEQNQTGLPNQCAKQPACLGLNTERPAHRTGPALFVPWSDAPGLSAHTLVVRSVGQEGGSPQWGVVHEHTRRPTPVFMNTKTKTDFYRPTWACGGRPPAPKQHTPTPASKERLMGDRHSTAKVDFGLLTSDFPFLFMNKQSQRYFSLRTIQDRRQSRSYMAARNMAPLRWADTGPVAWRPPRWRGVVVWRCTPPGGRAVLSEVCGRFKSFVCLFRHAAPRNQHPRSRVSSRRLREIYPRLGGSSAAAPDE